MADISEKIKAIRNEFKLTQEDFAHKIALSRSSLAQIETGKSKPTFDTIGAISSAFGVNPSYFYQEKADLSQFFVKNVKVNVSNDVIEKNNIVGDTIQNDENEDLVELNNHGLKTGGDLVKLRKDILTATLNGGRKNALAVIDSYIATKQNMIAPNDNDSFADSKKITAFYKEIYKSDPELDKVITDINELENLRDDFDSYIKHLNGPINIVYDNIISTEFKKVLSDEFLKENTEILSKLKKHSNSINELIDLINSVLLFEKFE